MDRWDYVCLGCSTISFRPSDLFLSRFLIFMFFHGCLPFLKGNFSSFSLKIVETFSFTTIKAAAVKGGGFARIAALCFPPRTAFVLYLATLEYPEERLLVVPESVFFSRTSLACSAVEFLRLYSKSQGLFSLGPTLE